MKRWTRGERLSHRPRRTRHEINSSVARFDHARTLLLEAWECEPSMGDTFQVAALLAEYGHQ